ncbi:hypothetical protein P8452_66202 [Trifolium repens]|nr:Transcription elongation factor (TFIIS) family protein [Trifolium repens]WJX83543.1 hypothetical protein P8452_66202 [Trifolium repens]
MKSEELDHWRKYFRSSNSDIFSIIDNAIVVAAKDCPKEFKSRRDKIAEKLFSVLLNRCKDCEKVEVPVTDNENGEVCKRGSVKIGASKESNVNGAGREEEANEVMKVKPASNYSFDEAEALTDELEAESQAIAEVLRIKEILRHKEDEPESVLFESLRRLELMGMSMNILESTAIGKAVNPLRKHGSKKVRDLAKILILAWKEMVDTFYAKRDPDAGENTPESLNPSGVVNAEEEEEEGGLPSIPLDEGAFLLAPPGMELSDQFFDGMDEDGNIQKSAPLNKNHGNGRRPAMDTEIKDKRNVPAFNETAIIPKDNKSQQLKKNEAEMRLNKPKPVAADAGPRRYLTSNIRRNGNVEPKMQQKLESSAVPKRPLNAQQDNSKCSDDAAKLEATKRRLQESYQQAENAKRQRTIQVMEINELPKQGAAHRNTHFKPGNQNRQRGLMRR